MFYKVIKRIFDFICALIGIIGTSPLWIVGIIGILISDWGPVFYTARRIRITNHSKCINFVLCEWQKLLQRLL